MKAKSSDQQREEQAKRKRQNHQCKYMGSSQRVPKPTLMFEIFTKSLAVTDHNFWHFLSTILRF